MAGNTHKAGYAGSSVIVNPNLLGVNLSALSPVFTTKYHVTQFANDKDPFTASKTVADREVQTTAGGQDLIIENHTRFLVAISVFSGSDDEQYFRLLEQTLRNARHTLNLSFTITLLKPNAKKEIFTDAIFLGGDSGSSANFNAYTSTTWNFQARELTYI